MWKEGGSSEKVKLPHPPSTPLSPSAAPPRLRCCLWLWMRSIHWAPQLSPVTTPPGDTDPVALGLGLGLGLLTGPPPSPLLPCLLGELMESTLPPSQPVSTVSLGWAPTPNVVTPERLLPLAAVVQGLDFGWEKERTGWMGGPAWRPTRRKGEGILAPELSETRMSPLPMVTSVVPSCRSGAGEKVEAGAAQPGGLGVTLPPGPPLPPPPRPPLAATAEAEAAAAAVKKVVEGVGLRGGGVPGLEGEGEVLPLGVDMPLP